MASALQNECVQASQTWKTSCSVSALLGTCAYVHGSPLMGVTGLLHYYQGSPATVDQLKNACEQGLNGTWVTK
jgi:hypothetical protein